MRATTPRPRHPGGWRCCCADRSAILCEGCSRCGACCTCALFPRPDAQESARAKAHLEDLYARQDQVLAQLAREWMAQAAAPS